MIGTHGLDKRGEPTPALVILFLALFCGFAAYAFGGMASSPRCMILGPWSFEPTVLSIVSFLAVGLPLLVMGLLQLHVYQGESAGLLLDALTAVYLPAMIMMVLNQLVQLPGSAALKWLIAGALFVASGSTIALLLDHVSGSFQGEWWVPARMVRAVYLAVGCMCLVLMFAMDSADSVGTCEYRVDAGRLSEGASAEHVLNSIDLWSGEEWESADNYERLSLLAPLVSAECSRLNVAKPPSLEAYNLREGLMGSYDAERNVIELDVDALDSGFEVSFDTVCHECAHAFQFACLGDPSIVQGSAWLWRVDEGTLEQWGYEDVHYISGDDDYDAYFAQDSEFSARAWAAHELEAFKSGGQTDCRFPPRELAT